MTEHPIILSPYKDLLGADWWSLKCPCGYWSLHSHYSTADTAMRSHLDEVAKP